MPLLENFEASIVWCPFSNHYLFPRPPKGVDQRIDKVCEKLDILEERLKQFLQQIRQSFDSNEINFVHTSRYQYQLEVSGAELWKRFEANDVSNEQMPHSFILLGKASGGCRRFTCDKLLLLSSKISEVERIYKRRMSPMIREMFLRFYSYREHWTNVLNSVAEIDVLCSLAKFSR